MEFPVLVLVGEHLINVNQIAHVEPSGVNCCNVYFAVPQNFVSLSGKWAPGSQGQIGGNSRNGMQSLSLNMSPRDFLALINKELALVHAMEKAAGHDNN